MNWGQSRKRRLDPGLRRMACAALLALACLFGARPAMAQNVADAPGTAQAVVLEPLTLFKLVDMDFGKILPSATAGTVTVNPVTSACSVAGGVSSFSNACQAAVFAGRGGNNARARITMSNITQLTGPGTAMTMDTFVVGANPSITFTGNTNSQGNGGGLLNGNGNQRYTINGAASMFTLNIGATLHVNPTQTPGIYTGTFTVTVQYN